MLRKITVNVGRFEAGRSPDYPQGVWNKIALDLSKDPKNAALFKGCNGEPAALLERFSEPVDINTSLQSVTRGPIKLRQRLGSPQRIPARQRA